jgi:2,3-bisphosphoglycerate-dependent phosphoglycerate mutase
MAGKIVMIRHGQSQWNLENRFTGWVDVDLSPKGEKESMEAAKLLKENDYNFDTCHTSSLKRAIKTAEIILKEMNLKIPLKKSWRLNERFYGGLTGLNKDEMRKKFGEEQVFVWRRSYSTRPPEIDQKSEYYPGNTPLFKDIPKKDIPLTESLKDTVKRVIPYWKNGIMPDLKKGKKILVAAHGNSIRAIVKHIDNIGDDEITKIEIPTGKPLVYEFNKKFEPEKHYYLE